jgi:radical SAM superfamily enzyme YgiQ (UPF0313 family)
MNSIHLVNIIPGTGTQDIRHPPLGLLYVGTSLKKNGYDVKIHQILPRDIEHLTDQISRDYPLLVGFSVTTGLSSHYSASMSKLLKSKDPATRIVWGGWHPSLVPKQCLSEDYVDIVSIGEGEKTIVEVANALETGDRLDHVRSAGFKSEGRLIINTPRQVEENVDLFELDYDLLDFKKFSIKRDHTVTTSFYSSRGCPFNCGFCCTPSMSRRRWRAHSVEYVVSHLVEMKSRFGVNDVYFADDNFFVDRDRAFTIIRRLRDSGISCSTIDIRVDFINKGILEELGRLGANGIFFGWESGSDRLLRLMHKNITVDQIISCAKLVSKYPISVWGSGILCLPTESRSEFNSTLRLALALFRIIRRGTIAVFPYMPLPGTEFLTLAVENGFGAPQNTVDWAKVDPQGPFYDITWIPWIRNDRNYKQKIRMTQEFTRNVLIKTDSSTNPVFNAIQKVFNAIAYHRVDCQSFFLPVDLKLYHLFKRCWQLARTCF